jgi:ABC-2 type transport system permease protein
MRNFWLVARYEYRRMVVRRSFVLGTIAIPLGIVILIALGVFVEMLGKNKLPVGYVDKAGILDVAPQTTLTDTDQLIQVRSFPNEEVALSALKREEIQAFFVFPPGYLQTFRTDLYYLQKPPSDDAWNEFNEFVRLNLVTALPDQVQLRVLEGPNITVQDITSNREFSDNDAINIILPFVASFLFLFATMSAASYMLRVVADEKENRTMEIMVTSVTPGQLIGGKATGLLGVTLTQLFIYVVAVVVGLKASATFVLALQQAIVPWAYLGVMALFFLPAYALISAVMVAIGGAVSEMQQGQQVAAILNLFFLLPLFLTPIIFNNPGHPAIVVLTLFPTTAFLTISLRWSLGTIPVWQLGLSWVLLVATMIFVVWAAARIFCAGMLRYGQPLSLKVAVGTIRGN